MTAAVALRRDVSALFIDPGGPYPQIVYDVWDETRDARQYPGPLPVVAHPPCGPWSSLRKRSKETTKDCAPAALETVRRWGGVLEHPSGSTFFAHAGLPRPGELPDEHGGITLVVDQCDWGHPARKRTWLYVVGLPSHAALPKRPPKRKPTHWCSGVHTPGARGKPPPGIKICSAVQRRRTPAAFAEWLVSLAAICTINARDTKGSTE